MVRNRKQLIRIAWSQKENGIKLVGEESKDPVECTQVVSDEDVELSYDYEREIGDRGMEVVFHCDFRVNHGFGSVLLAGATDGGRLSRSVAAWFLRAAL
jgi:hypothetical protein